MKRCARETPFAGEYVSLITPQPHHVTCYICRHTQEVIVKVDLKRDTGAGTSDRREEEVNQLEEKKIVTMNLAG